MDELLHVTTGVRWAEAGASGRVRCPPGGFIHLCTPDQLDFVLQRHFTGQKGLLLLTLDPAGLDVRWEVSEPGMAPFPHLYADLLTESVIGTRVL